MPESKKVDDVETIFYQGPSPDETTLVDFAKNRGFEFCKTSDTSVTVRLYPNSGYCETDDELIEKTYKVHRRMEFNSDRKRMSILFTDCEDGKVKLFTKGADSIIKARLNKAYIDYDTEQFIDDFLAKSSVQGLRTLLLAVRILDKSEFNQILQDFADAEDDIMNRDRLLQEVYDKYEQDLVLIGATAVEDRLQDDVPIVLEDMRSAGIKVWMLTGDKFETAKNIGYSCKLLTDDMVLFEAKGAHGAETKFTEELVRDNETMLTEMKKRGVIIDAEALSFLTTNPDYLKNFINVAKSANAVICSRVSPAQKAEVVRLIKNDDKNNITLAIGDGANDVSMILEAHIGIGIYGKEGVRAAQAADFAIHKFKYLWNLVLYHGRYNYIRISELILFFFYKNIIFTIPQLFFAFMSDFSAETVFDDWYISFYNLFFTALPILARGIYETDIDFKRYHTDLRSEIKLLYPKLYYVGQRATIFNMKNYLFWTGSGIAHAF